jgi:hypothetical protein
MSQSQLWHRMEVSAELHDPVVFLTGKELPASTVQGTDGPQSRSGHCGKAKGLMHLPEIFEVQPLG